MSPFDNCVFLLKNRGDLVGVLGLHVDDFIWGGDDNFEIVIGELRNVLSVGSENVGSFTFLGLEITFSENTVWLSQSGFIRGIEEMPETEFSDESRTSVRNLLGKLQWVASQTRPDLCYRICFYLCCLDKLELSHIRALNKIVRQLRFEKNLRIGLRSITNWNDAKILLFTDASLANNSDMSTQGGCIVGLSDRNNVISPLAWHSRKLKRVVHSTLGAELLALVDGLDVCINLSEQLNFYLGKNIRIKVLIDNKSLKDSLNSLKNVSEKRLRVDIAYVRDAIEKYSIEVCHVSTSFQLADSLTKYNKTNLEKFKSIILNQNPLALNL